MAPAKLVFRLRFGQPRFASAETVHAYNSYLPFTYFDIFAVGIVPRSTMANKPFYTRECEGSILMADESRVTP